MDGARGAYVCEGVPLRGQSHRPDALRSLIAGLIVDQQCGRLLTFATGPVARWVISPSSCPCFAVAGIASKQLEKATENEISSFLPGDAESLKALDEIKRFPGETAAVITVYQRTAGDGPRPRADRPSPPAAERRPPCPTSCPPPGR